MKYVSVKSKIFQCCEQFVSQRIELAQQGMDDAQRAANEESKSSAGDKYETGRAMMQIEKDKATHHLLEGLKLKKVLLEIDISAKTKYVQLGSLVMTDNGNFFLAIPAGRIELEDQTYFAISLASPIGMKLKNCKVGERILFNNRSYQINEIL